MKHRPCVCDNEGVFERLDDSVIPFVIEYKSMISLYSMPTEDRFLIHSA